MLFLMKKSVKGREKILDKIDEVRICKTLVIENCRNAINHVGTASEQLIKIKAFLLLAMIHDKD